MTPRLLCALAAILCGSIATVNAADRDGDGLSDVWEALYPGAVAADDPATGDLCAPAVEDDPDLDRLSNSEESALGSAPFDFRSAMPHSMGIDIAAQELRLKFPAVIGKRY